MGKNQNLRRARGVKNDEFYTQFVDIENELVHYESHFKNRVVYMNTDNPDYSNFWIYFKLNFNRLKIKKLIATYYAEEGNSFVVTFDGDVVTSIPLRGNGDFRNKENIEILQQVDVVVTNPPFSLFREYVAQLVKYNKKFLIIGNINAITYREIFPLLKEDRMWVGHQFNKKLLFQMPDSYKIKGDAYVGDDGKKYCFVAAITWYTNLGHSKKYDITLLNNKYNSLDYPKYDNYDAIDVSRVKDIPKDYYGAMGVPITFLGKYNPEQFEIIDGIGRYSMLTGPTDLTRGSYLTEINGKPKYARIIVQRRRVKNGN